MSDERNPATRLPNWSKAQINIHKLEAYCLNPSHPRGKHKARVFLAMLGLEASDANELASKIREAVSTGGCRDGVTDSFGKRFYLDFEWNRIGHRTFVRTTWIIRTGEDQPRLTSCYVLPLR